MLIFSGKIPITVNPFFLILIVLIGWLNSFSIPGTLVWMGVIFISVLIHELGHALTALSFGQQSEIELHGLGGVTRRRGPPIKLWQEFLIVLNGPLAGFLLFAFAYQIRLMLGEQPMSLPIYALQITIYVNLFWTIVNLLPVHPLDGGHLLRIVLEGLFGFRGVKVSLFISMVLSGVIGLLFIKVGALLIAVLFFMLTFESYRNWQSTMSLTKEDRNVELQERLKEAEKEMQYGNPTVALQQFQKIRSEAKTGIIFMAATECAAKLHFDKGQLNEAYDLLFPYEKKLSNEGLQLLHQISYHLGNWEEAIALGNKAYRNYPNYQTALLNSLCHSILGQVQPAVGWLRTAVNQGLPNIADVLKMREFDHIRNDPQFQKLQEKT